MGILSHFADHLEEISLSSLPTGVASEQEDDSDSPSNVRKLIRRKPEERAKQAPPDDLSITQNDRTPVEERVKGNELVAGALESDVSHVLQSTTVTFPDEEPYTIKCICSFNVDDGNTIFCEKCDTWQHINCYYAGRAEEALREDFDHSCADCKPRLLNRRAAFERMQQFLKENRPPSFYQTQNSPPKEQKGNARWPGPSPKRTKARTEGSSSTIAN